MGAIPAELTREEVKESLDALVDEIVNGDDSHWQQYAARLAEERALGEKVGMYKRWSTNNMFSLWAQVRRRNMSVKGLYGGVDQWAKRGRSIREGEEPLFIYGPMGFWVDPTKRRTKLASPVQAQAAQTQALTPQTTAQQAAQTQQLGPNGTPEKVYVRSKTPPVIAVYDYTQTVADDPDYVEPDWGVQLAFGDLDTLHTLVASAPVPVEFRDIASRNEHGWLDAGGITVDATMPIGNRIFTLLHELAHHHLGHLERLASTATPDGADAELFSTHAVCEQEAALTQFFAMKRLGLDESVGNNITEAAGAYLRSWMRTDAEGQTVPVLGHKKKRKLVLERFESASKAADKIVSAYQEVSIAKPELPATA